MSRGVVIVGAGPTGLAAAIEAHARGCAVTLIDEAGYPGGQIYRQAGPELSPRSFADSAENGRKKRLLERFDRISREIDYRRGATAYAAFANGEIHIAEAGGTQVLKPDATVLATGVREMAIPFPGWTTPGVMLAGGVQALLKSQQVQAGKRIVVAGSGPLPIVVAAQLVRAGGNVAALASLSPPWAMRRSLAGLWQGRDIMLEGARYFASVIKARVPRLTGYVPVRALGTNKLEAVVLGKVTADGSLVAGSEREIACDVLAINYGFLSNSELAAMAGARMRRDAVTGWVPEVDGQCKSSLSNIFVAGDCAGLRGALVAEAEGVIAGAAAAGSGGASAARGSGRVEDATATRARYIAFQGAVRELLRVPLPIWRIATDDTIVCRCENVRVAEVRAALESGHRTANGVKRNTRLGMGICGGRSCVHSLAALTELATGSPPAGMMTPRPLARPVTLRALAGQKPAAVR